MDHLSHAGFYFDELPGVFDISSALIQDREATDFAMSFAASVLPL